MCDVCDISYIMYSAYDICCAINKSYSKQCTHVRYTISLRIYYTVYIMLYTVFWIHIWCMICTVKRLAVNISYNNLHGIRLISDAQVRYMWLFNCMYNVIFCKYVLYSVQCTARIDCSLYIVRRTMYGDIIHGTAWICNITWHTIYD